MTQQGGGWASFTALERSPYMLGVKWLFTGRRLWVSGGFYALWFAALIWGDSLPDSVKKWLGAPADASLVVAVTTAAALWATTLKGREIRRGKERIKVADEYLAMREERLAKEFSDMCDRFLEEQELWRQETMARMYAQIIDQVERGVLKPRRHFEDDS